MVLIIHQVALIMGENKLKRLKTHTFLRKLPLQRYIGMIQFCYTIYCVDQKFKYYIWEFNMDNDNKFATRTHSQERKWLTSLGNGSLIEGIRIFIQRAKGNERGKKSNRPQE